MEETIRIPLDVRASVDGDLVVPAEAVGLVVFAHGSGRGRRSSRNRLVAAALQRRGLATLLIALLTREEEIAEARTVHLRFDVDMLATRLLASRRVSAERSELAPLPVGYFGASTGAAGALVAAADLPRVRAPTLLIVGSRDETVLDLNQKAFDHMTAPRRLEIVAGATH